MSGRPADRVEALTRPTPTEAWRRDLLALLTLLASRRTA